MRKQSWRSSPAFLVSVVAVLLALGGTVYAAKKVNGRTIVVKPASPAATAPAAAAACAARGGTLPGALELAAFAGREGVSLDKGDEWSSDISTVS